MNVSAWSIRNPIPTLMIFFDIFIIFSQPGALLGKQFEELIGKARELDMAQVHKEIADQKAATPDA